MVELFVADNNAIDGDGDGQIARNWHIYYH